MTIKLNISRISATPVKKKKSVSDLLAPLRMTTGSKNQFFLAYLSFFFFNHDYLHKYLKGATLGLLQISPVCPQM